MRKIALAALMTLMTASPALADGHDVKTKIVHAGEMLDVETGDLLTDQFIIIDGDRIQDKSTVSRVHCLS